VNALGSRLPAALPRLQKLKIALRASDDSCAALVAAAARLSELTQLDLSGMTSGAAAESSHRNAALAAALSRGAWPHLEVSMGCPLGRKPGALAVHLVVCVYADQH